MIEPALVDCRRPMAHAVERLAERARTGDWSHTEFLAACLEREVAARFPARKTPEEFDFDHQRSLKRDVIARLGALDFIAARDNVAFLGPPVCGLHLRSPCREQSKGDGFDLDA
jgi:DNA replication protein DnaC